MDMRNTDSLDARAHAGVVEEQRDSDPEVLAKARPPRRYTAAFKAQILAEYEQLDKAEKGRPVALREPVLVARFGVAQAMRPRRPQGAGQVVGSSEGRSPRSGAGWAPRREREAGRRPGQGPPCDRGAGKALRVVEPTRHRQSPYGPSRRDAMIDAVVSELVPIVGVKTASDSVGKARARWYRRHSVHPKTAAPKRPPRPQPRARPIARATFSVCRSLLLSGLRSVRSPHCGRGGSGGGRRRRRRPAGAGPAGRRQTASPRARDAR